MSPSIHVAFSFVDARPPLARSQKLPLTRSAAAFLITSMMIEAGCVVADVARI